jgi:hypothetical protein
MLGGLDPVIIFQFSALAPSLSTTIARIPLASKVPSLIAMPPIPVYLSEKIFNIVINGTGKKIDIETDTETLTNGQAPDVNQKGIQSSVEISITGKQDSVALTLLSAMIDQVYDRVTSKEYAISFMYGATTIFNALLHSYSVETIEGTDKLEIKVSLSKGSKNPIKANPVASVPGSVGSIPVGL